MLRKGRGVMGRVTVGVVTYPKPPPLCACGTQGWGGLFSAVMIAPVPPWRMFAGSQDHPPWPAASQPSRPITPCEPPFSSFPTWAQLGDPKLALTRLFRQRFLYVRDAA